MVELPKELTKVQIDTLLANKDNWRKHGREQRTLFRESVSEVGFVTPPIVNKRTMRLIDGHLRVSEMKQQGAESIEVIMVDVDEDTEKKMLTLLDSVSEKADVNKEKYRELIAQIVFDREYLERELRKETDKIKNAESAEYEILPEMLLNYNYVLLVIKDEVNFTRARELFDIDYKIDRYNGSKGMTSVVDGDKWINNHK